MSAPGWQTRWLDKRVRDLEPLIGTAVWGGITGTLSDQLDLQAALDGKAADNLVVKLAGAQTITGVKTFTPAPVFSAGLELGHASDTTLARIAAGRVSIEGGEIAKLNANEPFTINQKIEHTGRRILSFTRTTNGTDEKTWYFDTDAMALYLRALTDAGGASQLAMRVTRSGANIPSVHLFANGEHQIETQNRATAPATTGAQVRHADGNLYDVGMNVMPIRNTGSGTLTLGRADVGCTRFFSGSTSTWTLWPSSDTDVPIGSVINAVNAGSGNITINPGSGVTLERYNGTGAAATGSRTLAPGGVATIWRRTAAVVSIWGNAGLS